MTPTAIETIMRLLRAAELAQQAAHASDTTDTAREYHLLTAQATYRMMNQKLYELAFEADAEADRMEAEAAKAAAERKALKKQQAR